MNTTELTRLRTGLRESGWSERKIDDLLLYITTGDEHYKPQQKDE